MPARHRLLVVLAVSVAVSTLAAAQAPPAGPPGSDDRGPANPRVGGDGERGGGGERGGDRPGGRRGGFMRGAGDLTELLRPEFAPRDVALFKEGLSLDDAQTAIATAVIDDYIAAFELGVEPVNDSMAELGPALMRSVMSPEARDRMRGAFESAQEAIRTRIEQAGELSEEERQAIVEETMTKTFDDIRAAREESGDAAETARIMGKMVDSFDAWRTRRTALRATLLADIQGQLRSEQVARWPAFERALDREKTLPRGRLSGESTDLLRVADELELDEPAALAAAPALEAYELALATVLKARNDYFAQTEPRLLRAVQEMDVKTALDLVKKQVQHRIRVRDVNEEHRAAIAAVLPAPFGDEFKVAALKASFERVFRDTRADTVLEYIRSLDLSPEIVVQIDALEAAYRQELESTNAKLVQLTKKEEPLEQIRQAERFAGFLTGGFGGGGGGPFGGGRDSDDPVRVAFRERREMAEKHIERFALVLTPEQSQGMPKQERRSLGGGFDNLPEEMRTRIMQQVDSNGNGTIDPEEQEAAARMFRDRFRGRDGGAAE